jgi:hypothetical protein
VPRQMTTGGKPRLLGISKRGNKYLRKLLVHGARAALPSLSASMTPIGEWRKRKPSPTCRGFGVFGDIASPDHAAGRFENGRGLIRGA